MGVQFDLSVKKLPQVPGKIEDKIIFQNRGQFGGLGNNRRARFFQTNLV